MSDEQDTLSRRNVLRNSAVAAGGLAGGGVVTGTVAAQLADTGESNSRKRGGRGQVSPDGEVRINEPFTLMLEGTDMRNASCMSEESATQTYLTYSIQYCDSDGDEEDATLYMIPDEAELVEDETYVIRAVRDCRANDLRMVALGPARRDC